MRGSAGEQARPITRPRGPGEHTGPSQPGLCVSAHGQAGSWLELGRDQPPPPGTNTPHAPLLAAACWGTGRKPCAPSWGQTHLCRAMKAGRRERGPREKGHLGPDRSLRRNQGEPHVQRPWSCRARAGSVQHGGGRSGPGRGQREGGCCDLRVSHRALIPALTPQEDTGETTPRPARLGQVQDSRDPAEQWPEATRSRTARAVSWRSALAMTAWASSTTHQGPTVPEQC